MKKINTTGLKRIPGKDIIVFILVFFVLIGAYGYLKTSFLAPQGLHQWRQCVGAAYAMNYYYYDLDITESRIFSYISEGGESDKTIAECPIIYYFIAILYKIFGNDDSIFRIVNALILFLGLFALFKASKIILKDTFWAMFLPVVLFTSPTLIYYGNNFLPDTSAFGLVLIALYFIVKFWDTEKTGFLYLAAVFYALAGLFKITSLLTYIAVSGTFVLFVIFSKDFRNKYKFVRIIIPMLIPVVVVMAWYYFVHYYNTSHGGIISPVEIRPIWRLDTETITKTWSRIRMEWVHSYFNVYLQLIALASFLLAIIFFKKSNRFITTLTILTFIGGFFFSLLFFRSLYHHDYYLINVFIIVPFALMSGLILLSKYYPQIYKSIYTKLVAFILVGLFAWSAISIVNDKFFGMYNHSHRVWHHGFVGIKEFNRELGIDQEDLVISLPDYSINISLHLMRQPGWTAYGFGTIHEAERMDFLIDLGAKYLFVSDRSIYENEAYDYLKPYLEEKIGEHKNIDIYDLRYLSN